MDCFDLLDAISHHECCNLKLDEKSCMQSSFERELPLAAKCKHRIQTSDSKHAYVNDVIKKTANSVDVDLMAENKGQADNILDSDREDSPTEDLIHALEADLNIIGTDKKDFNLSQTEISDEFSSKDKKKKRKKRKGPIRSPNQIFAFNEDEQQKIEQSKTSLDTGKPMMGKALCKSATFPGSDQLIPSSKVMTNLRVEQFKDVTIEGHQSECGSPELKNSLYTRTNSVPPSFKLIPAVRGSHEQFGFGPRPKQCVKWAPDVQEPPCSSVSHTVRSHHRHQSKKKDHKHKHKGKLNHASGNDKNDKHFTCDPRCDNEDASSRLQSSSTPRAGNMIAPDVLPSQGSTLMPDKSHLIALKAPLFAMQMGQSTIPPNMASKPLDQCHKNREDDFVGKCTNDFISESKDNLSASPDAEFPLCQDSKCASSFLRTLQEKQLSFAEAT